MFSFANKKNYSKLSDKELLLNFRSENWNTLSNKDRVQVLQEVENRNATQQGRTPCTVVSKSGKEQYGCYYPSMDRIEVNVDNEIKNKDGSVTQNNSYQVLDTIYHEGEHAHQKNCVKNGIDPPQGLHKTTRDMCQVENTPGNYSGVIDYSNTTKELDSNNAAAKKVLESKGLFKDDPEFENYLEDREQYFERVNNKNMSRVRMQQNEAVYQSYSNGDIDLKQHDNMLLNEIPSEQPVFTEAKEVSEQIHQERIERAVSNEQKQNESESITETAEEQESIDDDSIDQEEENKIKRR